MSNFEKLVKEMRDAQIAYNMNPTGDNQDRMEELEDEVDEQLYFVENCPPGGYREVKAWLKKELMTYDQLEK